MALIDIMHAVKRVRYDLIPAGINTIVYYSIHNSWRLYLISIIKRCKYYSELNSKLGASGELRSQGSSDRKELSLR